MARFRSRPPRPRSETRRHVARFPADIGCTRERPADWRAGPTTTRASTAGRAVSSSRSDRRSGPPTLPNYFYNNLKQIVQTTDHVAILIEMVHDARVLPIERPHAPQGVRKWMGDSVGRWEGDTFVIETTNFTNKTRFRGSTDKMKVTERLHAPRRAPAPLPVHDRRSGDLDHTVDAVSTRG